MVVLTVSSVVGQQVSAGRPFQPWQPGPLAAQGLAALDARAATLNNQLNAGQVGATDHSREIARLGVACEFTERLAAIAALRDYCPQLAVLHVTAKDDSELLQIFPQGVGFLWNRTWRPDIIYPACQSCLEIWRYLDLVRWQGWQFAVFETFSPFLR